MAEDSDNVIDLTNGYNFTLADHNLLNNVVINLDTDDSFREEENRQNNIANRRRSGRAGRKRSHSKTTPTINPRVPVHDLCTPENNKNKRKSKGSRKQSQKTVIIEEPQEKKVKKSLGCCPICYEEYCQQRVASTKCGHIFCLQCLKRALEKEPRCPTCRTGLKGKSAYHAIYL